jgi:Ser/Thr protein kinase RdoA (MazF antagonist)
VLTRWIDGRDRSKSLTPNVLRALGETMARLHRFSETFVPPPGFVRPRWDFERLCGPGWERRRRVLRPNLTGPQRRFFDRLRPFLRERLTGLGESPEQFGVIHSDLHPWNVLVHRGQIRVLDTEDVAWGYYAFDVAVPLYELQQCWPDRFAALRDPFLAGYRAIRPIDAEPDDLAPFYAMRTIDIAVWLADTGQQARVGPWVTFCMSVLRGMT